MALWFHDAVYDPRSNSNEDDSAELAQSCLGEVGVSRDRIEAIQRMILSTKTHQPGDDADTALLIDIDLVILGKPPKRFWDYERGIREEYAWVPESTYRERRSEILERFLRRPTIYHVSSFRERYEISARENLTAAIFRLKQSEF